ncbi:hypothetical protein Q426_07580 [Streptococcus equi subsp. zooepidemicus CY]|nr:hypothetical protein Q426_07580 [Streptococcus equi subsp. zooepidemicus CY]
MFLLLILIMVWIYQFLQADSTPFIKNNKAVRKNVAVLEWLVRLADREKVNDSEVLTKVLERK